MWFWPTRLFNEGVIAVLALVVICLVTLYGALAFARGALVDSASTVWRLSLLIWVILLVAEGVFAHAGDEIDTYKGMIPAQAYGEGVIWVVASAFLLIIVSRRFRDLRYLFYSHYKWATVFALVCLISISYAPDKTYALAWWLKLALVITLLGVSIPTGPDLSNVVAFLRFTLWGFLLLAFIPLMIATFSPEGAFSGAGGRLADPASLSQEGAIILLLAQTLYGLSKRGYLLFLSALGAGIMVLAFGKAAIAAGAIAAALLLWLQGKTKSAVRLLVALTVLTLIVFAAVPQVRSYASSYDGADTLSGRTNVWKLAITRIEHRPVQGYGYLASRFMWLSERERVANFSHLHNSFLDVAHNMGFLGLVPLLLMHLGIVKNLRGSLRQAKNKASESHTSQEQSFSRSLYLLSAGLLALYVNLLINGMSETMFGGRASGVFMLFLAVLAMSHVVYRQSLGLPGISPSVQPLPLARES
jgi:O-antigen ligase